MKIKKSLCRLLVAAFLLLGGCGRREEEIAYTVYYVNTEGTRLMEVEYQPTAQTFEVLLEELMGKLASPSGGYASALSKEVSYNGFERGIDALRIDFSGEYYDLSNTEEILCRAAVVKTVTQIPGVTKVMITVEKEQLKDGDGKEIPAMDANTFIDTREGGINSYLYTTMKLYFPCSDGKMLEEEQRELHYSSNMALERVVVEQLLKGPESSGLKKAFSDSVKIQNIYTQNGICNINFDAEFNKTSSEYSVEPETALYAVVNSLCATCDTITGVRFEINGENDVMFRDKVSLNRVFEMDLSRTVSKKQQAETGLQEEIKEVSPADAMQETEAEDGIQTENEIQELPSGTTVVGVDPSLTEG